MLQKTSKTRMVMLVTGAFVALTFVVAAGVYGYREATARRAALERLAEATLLVRGADEIVIEVDRVVRAEITPAIAEEASEAATRAPEAISDLRTALEHIEGARPKLPEERMAEAAALSVAATARIDMLDKADPILSANVAVATALAPARSGWDRVVEGEKLMDQAVAEYNKLTRTAVTASRDLSNRAEAEFKQARDHFVTAHAAFAEAGLDAFVVYIEDKIALIGLSKQADASFLAGRNAEANRLSDQFNARDKELAEKAKKLPQTPEAAIAAAYERVAGATTRAYFEARDKATKADADLARITQ